MRKRQKPSVELCPLSGWPLEQAVVAIVQGDHETDVGVARQIVRYDSFLIHVVAPLRDVGVREVDDALHVFYCPGSNVVVQSATFNREEFCRSVMSSGRARQVARVLRGSRVYRKRGEGLLRELIGFNVNRY